MGHILELVGGVFAVFFALPPGVANVYGSQFRRHIDHIDNMHYSLYNALRGDYNVTYVGGYIHHLMPT